MRSVTVVLTIPVVALLTQPLWAPWWGAGILGEVAALGVLGSGIAVVVFFGLVALYCRSLRHLLAALAAPARIRSPRSVWLMFAIPFNFVEDFFIVTDIAASLRGDGRTAGRASRRWLVLGQTWCALQIASLLPGEVGVAAGVLAFFVWGWHWASAVMLRRRLALLPY